MLGGLLDTGSNPSVVEQLIQVVFFFIKPLFRNVPKMYVPHSGIENNVIHKYTF